MDKEQAFVRLNQAIDYLKDNGRIHKDKDIVEDLGMNKGNVSRALSGNERYFTAGFLKRFATAYSDYINEEWLLTGEGAMAKPDKNLRPHYPATVSAGVLAGAAPSVSESEVALEPFVKRFGQYDYTIDISGHSMEPTFVNEGIVACRKLYDKNEIKFGKPYVIVTRDGAVVKRIISKTLTSIRVASDNPAPEYKPYSIDLDSILSIDEVVGAINPENSFEDPYAKFMRLVIESNIDASTSNLGIDEIIRKIKSNTDSK